MDKLLAADAVEKEHTIFLRKNAHPAVMENPESSAAIPGRKRKARQSRKDKYSKGRKHVKNIRS